MFWGLNLSFSRYTAQARPARRPKFAFEFRIARHDSASIVAWSRARGSRSGFTRKKRKAVREGIVLTHGKRCPSVVSGTFLVEIGTGEPVEMGRDFDQPTLLPSKYLSSKAIAHQAQGYLKHVPDVFFEIFLQNRARRKTHISRTLPRQVNFCKTQ